MSQPRTKSQLHLYKPKETPDRKSLADMTKILSEARVTEDNQEETAQWKKQAIANLANFLYALTNKQINKSSLVNHVSQSWIIIERTIRQTTIVEYKRKPQPKETK